MSKLLQLRGGTTSQHNSFTGAVREVTVDTDKDTLIVHDGSTQGGFELAKIASPALTGNPTAPTQSAGNNSTRVATTAYTDAAIAALADSAPSTLNTLNELAAALGDDANYATTTTNAIAAKLPLTGGAMTGAITTNSTFDGVDIATRDAVLTSTTTTANAALPKAGGTMTGDLILGDNVKVEVGSASGGDLQIYHDGTNSYIDNHTGLLTLRVNGTENAVQATVNGSVALMYDGSQKFQTTAGGIAVTGNVYGTANIGLDGTDAISFSNGSHTSFTVNGNEEMRLEADGDLHVDGDVIAYSTTISDERLKDNIEVVDGALDKVKELKGVTFTRKQDGQESAGVIAQDVEKVLPQAVKHKALPLQTGDDGLFKTVQYDALHALLIESIKELSARVEELEKK
jgi:hypothetical protein